MSNYFLSLVGVDYLPAFDHSRSMTLRLYEDDPYLSEFTARVQKIDGDRIFLDRTAFYPGGGGQERDRGTIEGLEVTELKGKGEIAHLIPGHLFEIGQEVTGRIDWENRLSLMRAHTGEHLLFSALSHNTELELVKISLTSEKKVLIVKGYVTWEIILEATREVNTIIAEGAPVICRLMNKEELTEGGPRVKLERIHDQKVRVVFIGKHDQAACAGVHLKDANEIGMLMVDKLTSAKPAGDWEIEFLVGPTAVSAALVHSVRALMLAERMGALPQDSLTAFDNREREMVKCRESLKHYAREALSKLEPSEVGGMKVFSGVFTGLDRKLLMEKASEIVSGNNSFVTLVSQDDKTFLVLACSSDVRLDCVSLLNKVLGAHGGRGGGRSGFASGGTNDQVDAERLLENVLNIIKNNN